MWNCNHDWTYPPNIALRGAGARVSLAAKSTRMFKGKETMVDFVRLDAADNVVSAIRPLEAGAAIESVKTTGLVPRGHKVATQAIAKGETIIKYNQIIGYASVDIAPGDHVHTQNVEFRGTDHDYEFSTDLRPVTMVPEADRDTFMGFRPPQREGWHTQLHCGADLRELLRHRTRARSHRTSRLK